jgi:hypothetical protein
VMILWSDLAVTVYFPAEPPCADNEQPFHGLIYLAV